MATPEDSMDPLAGPKLARCRAALAENRAARLPEQLEPVGLGEQHSLVAGNASFWRGWALAGESDVSMYLDYLTEYVSAKNQTKSAFVQDPMVTGVRIPGKFRMTGARRIQQAGTVWACQGLSRVYAPASAAELAKCAFRRARGNEILEVFGLGPGEADDLGFIFPDMDPANETVLLGLADADLVTALPGAGWTYVSRKLEHGEDNAGTLVVLFRKVAWNAFNYLTPDLETFDNYDTEHSEATQLFININKADALANLYTSGLTKYNVMRVKVGENKAGALTIERVLIHEVYGSLAAGAVSAGNQETLNVHGLVTGTLDGVLVINENLKSLSSAYTAVPAGGYTLAHYKEQLTDRGLWNKYYFYSKATWTNTTPTWTPAGRSDVGGFGESARKVAPGVPIGSAASLVAAATADSGYVLGGVTFQEGLPGEARLAAEHRKTFDYGSGASVDAPVKIGLRPAWGKQGQGVVYWWPRVTPSRIDAVVTAAASLSSFNTWFSSAYPVASGWGVRDVDIRRDPDGPATVIATIGIPTEKTADTFESWYDETDVWNTVDYVRDSTGEIVKTITYGNQQAHRITRDDAADWLAAYAEDLIEGASGIQRLGPNKYLATAVWKESET